MDEEHPDTDDEMTDADEAQTDADEETTDEKQKQTDADDAVTTISAGRNFEQAYRLDAAEVGAFLIELGEQLRDGDELTLSDDEWELPFAFGEPIELEIDYDGVGEPELEIELELPGRTDERAPAVS